MARQPKPWYRSDRSAWFVTIAGVRHNLGTEKKPAFDRFYDLMRQPTKVAKSTDSEREFAATADAFLEWVNKNRAPDTYEWYRYRLERFCQCYPDLLVRDIKPYHVQQWVDSYSELTRTSKRKYIRSVKRCVKWAKQQGYLDYNPIEGLEAPGAEARDLVVTPEEFSDLLKKVPDRCMRQVIQVAFETGCRPQEILHVEARHFDAGNQRWVFPVKSVSGNLGE